MAFVHERRSLAAGCASHPFPEEVKVTVFMQNLNKGPPRTQLFRARPKTFEEAVSIAMSEDQSLTAANSSWNFASHASKQDSNEPKPMDIGQDEQERRVDESNVTSHRCAKKGHYARECRAPNPVKNAHLNNFARSQRGRGAGRGRGRGGRGRGNTPALSSTQGNAICSHVIVWCMWVVLLPFQTTPRGTLLTMVDC